MDGADRELLRFECMDNRPHYHYDPGNTNVRIMLDRTLIGNPLRWTMTQLRKKLPAISIDHARCFLKNPIVRSHASLAAASW